ncbi:MAG: c-type cytochrome [Gallionella sp.]|jgi:cytochrome c553
MHYPNLTLLGCLILTYIVTGTTALADTEVPTSYSGIQGGRISLQANLERKTTLAQRYKAGNPVAGQEKSQLCQGCHGEFGDSTDPFIPKLAGQRANYITKQIRNYQEGMRTHEIMEAMAETINEDELADIAAYFSHQTKMKGKGKTENKRGKDLFVRSDTSKMMIACVNCHGEKGKGIESPKSAFPVLGGQSKEYIRQQLINFRSGDRRNSPYKIMNRIAESLTDIDIESLADYVSVQP